MYKITITFPGEEATEVWEALDNAPVHLLEVHEGPSTSVVLETNDVSVVDALKTWLDSADPQGGKVFVKAGDYQIDMGRFCRQCQADKRDSPRDALLPCVKPPEGSSWCPLSFVMEHTTTNVEMTDQALFSVFLRKHAATNTEDEI